MCLPSRSHVTQYSIILSDFIAYTVAVRFQGFAYIGFYHNTDFLSVLLHQCPLNVFTPLYPSSPSLSGNITSCLPWKSLLLHAHYMAVHQYVSFYFVYNCFPLSIISIMVLFLTFLFCKFYMIFPVQPCQH